LKEDNKYICFHSNTAIFYFLIYRRQASVIRTSSGHRYLNFM